MGRFSCVSVKYKKKYEQSENFSGNHIELDNPTFLKTTNYLYLYKNNNSKNRDKKQRIKLGESELRHMISESVKRVLNESKNPKGELEDALNNVLGILHAYNDTEFGIDKKILRHFMKQFQT